MEIIKLHQIVWKPEVLDKAIVDEYLAELNESLKSWAPEEFERIITVDRYPRESNERRTLSYLVAQKLEEAGWAVATSAFVPHVITIWKPKYTKPSLWARLCDWWRI